MMPLTMGWAFLPPMKLIKITPTYISTGQPNVKKEKKSILEDTLLR